MNYLDTLVHATIARYDWNSIQESDGPAGAIPSAFIELLTSKDPEASVKAYWKLENHVVLQGSLFKAAVCVASLIGAALANGTRPKWVKIQLLELLFQIVSGESHPEAIARGNADLGTCCRNETRKFLWILYGLFQEGELWRAAREVIERVDVDLVLLSELDRLNQEKGRFDVAKPLKI